MSKYNIFDFNWVLSLLRLDMLFWSLVWNEKMSSNIDNQIEK